MKKVLVFMLLLIAGMVACGPEEKTQPLSYQGFIENIWDFETHPEEYVFKGSTPIIVDFYANWCGPCRKLLPLMETMANEYDGRITVYTVDVDKEKPLANFFQVKGLPVFFIFSTDGIFKRYNGTPTEAEFRGLIEEELNKKIKA